MNQNCIDFIGSLLKYGLELGEKDYTSRAELFMRLDGKAQHAITAAGLFLGGILAFFSKERLAQVDERTGRFGLIMLLLITFLLIAAIVLCALAMRTRKVADPYGCVAYQDLLIDIRTLPGEEIDHDLMRRIANDMWGYWCAAIQSITEINQQKAAFLRLGQNALIGSILLLAVFLLSHLMAQ